MQTLIANITFTSGTLEGINIADHILYSMPTRAMAEDEARKRSGQHVSNPCAGSPYRINSIRVEGK